MSQRSSPILNPVVYLNYLNHTVAIDYEITRDVSLAILGALAWDILSSTPEDYRLIQTGKISAVLLAYFLARPSALTMVVLDVMLKTGPINNCTVTAIVLMALQAISTVASSYLFLKRVHAVYYGHNVISHFFSFMWLVVVGTSCAVFPGTLYDYSEIADTKHCLRYQKQAQLTIAYVTPFVFDFLIYSAISSKISSTHGSGKKWRWKDIWRGKALPHFSQAILSGGQQYYLITNSIIVARLVLGSQPNISPTLQLLLSSPAVALTSVMACRVYRNLIESLLDSEWMDGKSLTAPKFADKRIVNQTLPTSATVSVSPYSESDVECGCSVPKGEV